MFLAGGTFAPAPDFGDLPVDPEHPAARLVPPDGRVSVAGEEWHFADIRSVALDDRGRPLILKRGGARPSVTLPARVSDCPISIGFAASRLVEETDAPPVVLTAFGRARSAQA